jgi:hypothetical protein
MKILKVMSIIAVLFLAGVNVVAQIAGTAADDREVGKQFRELQSKSWEIRRNNAYRETSEILTDEKTPKELKQTSISEFVPPDRRRYVISAKAKGKVESYESITIGDQVYSRQQGGPWKSEKVDRKTGSGYGNSGIKFIEKTTIDGRPVTVFEDEWSTYSDSGDSSGVTRYWFTDDGYLLKMVDRRSAEGAKPARGETSTFEYDPNIRIETPVIK